MSSDDKAARKRAWYETNREKVAAQQKAYREANREKVAARQKAYRERKKAIKSAGPEMQKLKELEEQHDR